MSKKELIDWGSVKIDIPTELRFTDAKGKIKLIPTLTNSEGLKTKNKMKSIKISTHDRNEVILKPSPLVNNRYEWNKNEIIIPDEMAIDKFTKNGLIKKAKNTTTKTGNLASNARRKPIILKRGDQKAFNIIDVGNISEIVISKPKTKKKEEVVVEKIKPVVMATKKKEEVEKIKPVVMATKKKEEVEKIKPVVMATKKKEEVKPKVEEVKLKRVAMATKKKEDIEPKVEEVKPVIKEKPKRELMVIKKEEPREETREEKDERKKREINDEIKKLKIEEDEINNILAEKTIDYDLVKTNKAKKYDKIKNDLKNEIEKITKEFVNIRQKIRKLENLRDRGDEKIDESMIKRNKSYFDILGISSSSNTEDIKKAYKKLAIKYHPDKNKDPEAPAKYIEIVDAYNKLMVGRGKKKKISNI